MRGFMQDPLAGIIPRSLHQLFQHLEQQVHHSLSLSLLPSLYWCTIIWCDVWLCSSVDVWCQGSEFSVRVSFLELYNEELIDLLSTGNDTSKLRIFEDSTRKVCKRQPNNDLFFARENNHWSQGLALSSMLFLCLPYISSLALPIHTLLFCRAA